VIPVITSWTQAVWIALDVLLVSLLIYQILVMIRGTRAMPMLVGLIVLCVTFYFVRIGELVTLNWAVNHILPYIVFAMIVVFFFAAPRRRAILTTILFSPPICFLSIKPAR
jgi:diadenylate cyclase